MSELTPKELASAIGVSQSSIKRWVDSGLLAATRTAGGHRRIERCEAIRFIRAQGTPLQRPELLQLPPHPAAAAGATDPVRSGDHLYEALLRDDPETARGLILGTYLAGTPVADLCDTMMRPALHRVGELWRHSEDGIRIEHRAVDTCIEALSAVRATLPAPGSDAPLAVGGAPSKDIYLIPSLMITVVLSEHGFRTHNLGPDTPIETTLMAVERERPALVWQSLSSAQARGGLEKLADTLAEQSIPLVIGGQALEQDRRGAPSNARWLRSMGELAGFARGIHERS